MAMLRRASFSAMLTAITALTAIPAQALDDADVVAHWPLDGGEGTIAEDASGHGFDATIVGEAAWTEYGGGPVLRLNGEGQYLIAPEDLPLLSSPEGGTVMLWFRPEGRPVGGLVGRTEGNTYAGARFTLAHKPSAGDRFVQNLSTGESHDHANLFPIPRSGYWNHCVLSYDGSEVRTYINGALMRREELDFTPEMGNGPLWIGRTDRALGGRSGDIPRPPEQRAGAFARPDGR